MPPTAAPTQPPAPTATPAAPPPTVTAGPPTATAETGTPVPSTGGGGIVYEGANQTIWRARADGSGAVQIGQGRSPLWAPDGSRIAFLAVVASDGGPNDPFPQVAIRTVDLDGGAPQDYCRGDGNAQIDLVSWSPDGQVIALNAGQSPPGALYLCHLSTNTLDPALHLQQGAATRVLAWTPDGSAAVWEAGNAQGDYDLYYGDPAQGGAGAQRLTQGQYRSTDGPPAVYLDARFSPDGRTLAVAGTRVFFLSAPGQDSTLAGTALDGFTRPARLAWSPDGGHLLVWDNAARTVSVVSLADGAVTALPGAAGPADWRPTPTRPGPPPVPPAAASPTPGGAPGACSAGMLHAKATWQGATGSLLGAVTVGNASGRACTLDGYPTIAVQDASGPLAGITQLPGPATSGPRAGAITLAPGAQALVRIQWRNWCTAPPSGPLSLAVTLPNGGGTLTAAGDPSGPGLGGSPRCDDQAAGSTLSVGPFEPAP